MVFWFLDDRKWNRSRVIHEVISFYQRRDWYFGIHFQSRPFINWSSLSTFALYDLSLPKTLINFHQILFSLFWNKSVDYSNVPNSSTVAIETKHCVASVDLLFSCILLLCTSTFIDCRRFDHHRYSFKRLPSSIEYLLWPLPKQLCHPLWRLAKSRPLRQRNQSTDTVHPKHSFLPA